MNNKALVVIDFQNDITKHYRGIIGNINAAIEWVMAEGMITANDINEFYAPRADAE